MGRAIEKNLVDRKTRTVSLSPLPLAPFYFLLRRAAPPRCHLRFLDATTSIGMTQGKRKRANEPRSALIVTSSRRCRSTSVARSPRVSMRRKLPRRPQRPRARRRAARKGFSFEPSSSLSLPLSLVFSIERSISVHRSRSHGGKVYDKDE